MDTEKIGKFITVLRKEKKYSQEKLAELIPVSRQSVSKWELGKSIPDSLALAKLCEIFNVSVSEILAGERIKDNNSSKSKEIINELALDMINNKNKKPKKIKYLILLILLLSLIFLSYYFINSYNSIKVYTVSAFNDTLEINDGLLVTTKSKIYFKLGNIKNLTDNEILSLRLYYINSEKKNSNIFYCDTCETLDILLIDNNGYNAYFEYQELDNIVNNMKLEIKFSSNNIKIIDIDLKQDFANNNILFYNKYKNMATNIKSINSNIKKSEIIDYIKSYFTKTDDGYLYDKNGIYSTLIDDILYLEYKEEKRILSWNLDFASNVVHFIEYNNEYEPISQYKYDLLNMHNCLDGKCQNSNKNWHDLIVIFRKIFNKK